MKVRTLSNINRRIRCIIITGWFTCVKPQGAFYLFPQSPEPDDVAFVQKALQYNLLLVPGRGFAMPGYFRLAYCVDFKTIERALPAFEKLAKHYF